MIRKIRKAVIPAAGLGTRFLPATKAQPKEMLPIVDKPTIQYVVEEAVASGITDIVIVTGRGKRAIEDHFDISYEMEAELRGSGKDELYDVVHDIAGLASIFYVRQKEAKGLGHAISCARPFIGDEPFAILLGDDIVDGDVPCLKQLIDAYERYGGSILGVGSVPRDKISSYGIIEGERVDPCVHRVRGMVEKPSPDNAPSNIAILARYIITPAIFDILESTSAGFGGEIQLTDALLTLCAHEPMYALEFSGKRYDVGNRLGFLEANIELALKRDDLRAPLSAYLRELSAQLS